MKRYFLSFFASCIFLVAAANSASAAGFALYEWSARGNALGGTLVGRADDPSAVAFNPAGMTQLQGTQIAVGASFAHPMCDVVTIDGSDTPTTTSNKDDLFVIPHLYITQQINEKWTVGFGEFSRFGLGFGYDDTWPGAFNVYQATISSFSLNPNLAYKVSDRLSVALGVEYVYVDMEISKRFNPDPSNKTPDPKVSPKSELTADGDGFGLTAGLHYKLDNWRFGFGYHSQAKVDASGETNILGTDHQTTGTVVLPDMLNFGITYYPKENLSVEVGAIHTRWSTYTDLDLNVEGKIHRQPKDANDVWRYNIGAEYGVTDNWDLRASYAFDEAPENQDYVDYMIPAANRHLFNIGAGYTYENWTVDIALTYIKAEKVHYADAVGSVDGILPGNSKNGVTHMAAATLGYAF